MMKSTVKLAVLGLVFYLVTTCSADEEVCAECANDPQYCCLKSTERYGTPRCEKRLKSGETCRPNTDYSPVSATLIKYEVLCPCEHGLTCRIKRGQAVCMRT